MRVRTRIQKLEEKLGMNEEFTPIIRIITQMGKEWHDEIFKSKEAQEKYLEKIEELEIEEAKKSGDFPIVIICLHEREVKEKIKKYNLNPTLYLK